MDVGELPRLHQLAPLDVGQLPCLRHFHFPRHLAPPVDAGDLLRQHWLRQHLLRQHLLRQQLLRQLLV